MSSKVMVISPHPDDETLGCGGMIGHHLAEGDAVEVIFLTSGEGGGHGRSAEDTVQIREAEARAATAILGVTDLTFWGLRDGALRASDSLVQTIARSVEGVNVVYAPHPSDGHPDHRATARAVRSAVASLPPGGRPELRFFEIWTPLAAPNLVWDVTPHMDSKLAAIRAYRSQNDAMRFDDAITGLNRYRGEMHCWWGGEFAEAFLVVHP